VFALSLMLTAPAGCNDPTPGSLPSDAAATETETPEGVSDMSGAGDVGDVSPSSSDVAGDVDSNPEVEPWTGAYSELNLAGLNLITQEPVAGLEICSLDFPDIPCQVTTQDMLAATFNVPRTNQLFILRDPDPSADAFVEEEAFVPVFVPIGFTEDKAKLNLAVASLDGTMLGFASSLAQLPLRKDRAHISILVREDGTADTPYVAGATFAAECPNDGIYYVKPDFTMVTEPPGTHNPWGTAIIFNIDADACRIGIDHPERDCLIHNPGFSDDPEGPRFVTPTIAPGHLTVLQFKCPAPAPSP